MAFAIFFLGEIWIWKWQRKGNSFERMGTWRLETARAALFFLKSQPVVKTLSFIAFQLALSYEVKRGAFISCGLETGNSICMFSKVWKHFYFIWFFWGRFWIQDRSRLLDRYYADFGFYRTDLPGTPTLWIFPGGPPTHRWLGWGRRQSNDWLIWCITPVKIKISWYTLTCRKDTIFQRKTMVFKLGVVHGTKISLVFFP